MPFWPPFLTAGKRFVKNTSSCGNKLITLLFYRIKQNPATALGQPPADDRPHKGVGQFIESTSYGSQMAHHVDDVCVGGGVGDRRNSRPISTVENLRVGRFLFPPEP